MLLAPQLASGPNDDVQPPRRELRSFFRDERKTRRLYFLNLFFFFFFGRVGISYFRKIRDVWCGIISLDVHGRLQCGL